MEWWRAATVAGLLVVCAGPAGCRRKHIPVSMEPELGYPACGDAGTAEAGPIIGEGHIRSGPWSQEQNVVERFSLQRTACGYTFRARQEWPLAATDVEVRFDSSLAPLWAWKRSTIPGSKRADGSADIRRYELRTPDVFIKRSDVAGPAVLEKLLAGGRRAVPAGQRVGAVIGPGRGLLTAWLMRARLPVGGTVRELVLDFRADLEALEMATLERSADQFEPILGKTVRVYTFFGRETVFADDADVVVGDLAGMRPSEALKTPEPPPIPSVGEPDPAHTP